MQHLINAANGNNAGQKLISANAIAVQQALAQPAQHLLQQQQQFPQTQVSMPQSMTSPVNTFTSLSQNVNGVRPVTNANLSNLNRMINPFPQANVGQIMNNVAPTAASMSQLANLQTRQNNTLNGVVSNVSANSVHNAIGTVQNLQASPGDTVGISPPKPVITTPPTAAGIRSSPNVNNRSIVGGNARAASQSPQQQIQVSPHITKQMPTNIGGNVNRSATSTMTVGPNDVVQAVPRQGARNVNQQQIQQPLQPGRNGESVAAVKNEPTNNIVNRRRPSTGSTVRNVKTPTPVTPGNNYVTKTNVTANQNISVANNQVRPAPSANAPSKTWSAKERQDAITYVKESEKKHRRQIPLKDTVLSEEEICKIKSLIPELQRMNSEMDEALANFWCFTRNQRGLEKAIESRLIIDDFLKGWQQKKYFLKVEAVENAIKSFKGYINAGRNQRRGIPDDFYTQQNKGAMNQSDIENLLPNKQIDLKFPEKRERNISIGANKRPKISGNENQRDGRRASIPIGEDEVDNEEEECSSEKMENTFARMKLVLKGAAEKEKEREIKKKDGLGPPTRMDRLMIEGHIHPPRMLHSTKVFVGLGSAI
jgi:hypothetical protein